MRIALCSDYFYPKIGGITTHIEYLAKFLEKRGHDVIIVTKKASFNDKDLGLNVVRVSSLFGSANVLDVPYVEELEGVLRREGVEVVHGHHAFSPISLFSISIGKKIGVGTVLTNHSIQFMYDFDLMWRPSSYILFPVRQMINSADRIIAVSRAATKFIQHFTNKDIVTIPNGVDVREFEPRSKEFDGKSILFVGRLVYRKGILKLLRVMKYIVKENSNAHLTIAGTGYLAPFLRYLINSLNLQKNISVVLNPSRSEIIKLYQKANVFVMPSIFGESFGIVILEAMASKTPVVAADQGGISEVIKHGETGFLVKNGNEQEMAKYVLELLEDREYWRRISDDTFREVKKYDWEVIGPRIEELYNRKPRPSGRG